MSLGISKITLVLACLIYSNRTAEGAHGKRKAQVRPLDAVPHSQPASSPLSSFSMLLQAFTAGAAFAPISRDVRFAGFGSVLGSRMAVLEQQKCRDLSVPAVVMSEVGTGLMSQEEEDFRWVPEKEDVDRLTEGKGAMVIWILRNDEVPGNAPYMAELQTDEDDLMAFNLYANGGLSSQVRSYKIRRIPFNEGKNGGTQWSCGGLMTVWATSQPGGVRGLTYGGAEFFRGKRVLELGSGLGLTGIALAGEIASSVVLTEFGYDDPAQSKDPGRKMVPSRLLQQLKANVNANGLQNAEVRHLDWYDYVQTADHAPAAPKELFERVIAADVAYYKSDVPAFAAAFAAHLGPGGMGFVFFRERDWEENDENVELDYLTSQLERYGRVSVTYFLGYRGDLSVEMMYLIVLMK